jgi:hypothetical protein
MYRLQYACCGGFWTRFRPSTEQSECPACQKIQWPAEMYQVEKTEAGWQDVMPGYA